MTWIATWPWTVYLVLLVLIGLLGLRVTLQVVATLMPQYLPIAAAVDRAAQKSALLCLRFVLSIVIVSLTVVVYALLAVELAIRGLLRAARFAGKRVGVQLPLPLPEAPQVPRIRLLLSVLPPEPKRGDAVSVTQADGNLTSIRN